MTASARAQRSRRRALGTATALLILALPTAAGARTEQIRWTHPSAGEVGSFVAHWGTASGSHPNSIDVGKPTANGSGIFQVDVEVPDDATVFITMTAEDATRQSILSNELRRDPQPPPAPAIGAPGRPTLVMP